MPQMGIETATWVCAPAGNQTHELLVHGTTLQTTGMFGATLARADHTILLFQNENTYVN